MAGAKDQLKGKTKQAVGGVRKRTGRAPGDEEMEIKGATQQVKGKAQDTIGKATGD